MAVRVTGTDKGSPAQQAELSGAVLLSINGSEINDMLDYEYYSSGAVLELAVMRGAKLEYVTVEKDEYEPLGCAFESYLIDKKHSCRNKCMFCFIDQLPKGLRETLYFKDDDERLSFLFGNYITLTNLGPREVERIKEMRISPINISVHTVEPELRVQMMTNKNAGAVLRYLDEFAAAGIEMNCQVVLCRGVNDGAHLKKTVEKLAGLHPAVRSVAVVPSGLTRFREGLYPLTPYDRESARAVLALLEPYGEAYRQRCGARIVYPADEWFLLAGQPIPPGDYYDDYPQLENGVGMWRMLHDQFLAALPGRRRTLLPRGIDVATGTLAYPLIRLLADQLQRLYPNVRVTVHRVENRFFGGNIGVAGLLTGTDLIAQLKGRLRSRTLGIPEVMLRDEKDKFLDDVSVKQLEKALGVRVRVLPQDGAALAAALLK